jgi:hypothetical protein
MGGRNAPTSRGGAIRSNDEMTDHPLDHPFLRDDADAVNAIAKRIERLTCDLAITGSVPFNGGNALWLVKHIVERADGARATLFTLLSLADVLAAQTATLADSGSRRATGAEATALRLQAAMMRVCRRAIVDLRREIATLCSKRAAA